MTTLSIVMGEHERSGILIRSSESFNVIAEKVNTLKFDDYFRDNGLEHARFIKIDVEGAEMLVLQGMSSVLEKQACDYLLVEVSDAPLRSIGSSITEVITFLQDYG